MSLENGSTFRNLNPALKFKGRGQVFILFVLPKCSVQTTVGTQYVLVELNLKKKKITVKMVPQITGVSMEF